MLWQALAGLALQRARRTQARTPVQVAADLGLVAARHTRVMQYIGVVNMIREFHVAMGTPPGERLCVPSSRSLRLNCYSLFKRVRNLGKGAPPLLEKMLHDANFVPAASSILTREGASYYRAAAAPPLPDAPGPTTRAGYVPERPLDILRRIKALYERALVPEAQRGALPSLRLLQQYGDEQLWQDMQQLGLQRIEPLLVQTYGPPTMAPAIDAAASFRLEVWRRRASGGTSASDSAAAQLSTPVHSGTRSMQGTHSSAAAASARSAAARACVASASMAHVGHVCAGVSSRQQGALRCWRCHVASRQHRTCAATGQAWGANGCRPAVHRPSGQQHRHANRHAVHGYMSATSVRQPSLCL